MKKIIFNLLAIFLFNVTCFGQLKVLSDGSTQGGGSNGELDIESLHGLAIIGPRNSTWCHLETDRSYFYINQPITLGSGEIAGYTNTNLSLCAGSYSSGNPTRMTILASNGNVGIGTTTPSYKLDVYGDIATYGTLQISSDERLKRDIKDITQSKVDNIYSLAAKTYIKKYPQDTTHAASAKQAALNDSTASTSVEQDTTHQIGFLAQDVKQYFPELVKKDANGYYTVDYVSMIPLLVEALKEQKKHIADLEKEVTALSNQSKQ